MHDDVTTANWAQSPVSFGILVGSYEGIGTVIPIETSMRGSRHLYNRMLHASLALLSVILCCFGLLSYMQYGPDVTQIIIAELPENQALARIVRGALVVGITFTYPLQLFPVIQVAEQYLLGMGLDHDNIEGGDRDGLLATPAEVGVVVVDTAGGADDEHSAVRKSSFAPHAGTGEDGDGDVGDTAPLLINAAHHRVGAGAGAVAPKAPPLAARGGVLSVRNQSRLLRAILVMGTAGLAVLFRDDFSYFTSIIGSVGSSLLAFILPCVFQNKLFEGRLSRAVIAKNYAIAIFGFLGGMAGLYVNIQTLISGA